MKSTLNVVKWTFGKNPYHACPHGSWMPPSPSSGKRYGLECNVDSYSLQKIYRNIKSQSNAATLSKDSVANLKSKKFLVSVDRLGRTIYS